MKKLLIASLFLMLSASVVRAQLNVYYVDVGQGDSTYIELPGGSNVLIDGGPTAKGIMNFLNAKNVTHIDHVVLTHPHSDHYTGLKTVFKKLSVKDFYDSKAENKSAQGDNTLRSQAQSKGVPIYYPKIGDTLNWDSSVNVKVLNTCEDVVESRDNTVLNNCSIVLKFTYNGTSLVFSGDAEEGAESDMSDRFGSGLKSYALKAGHHGSNTASSAKYLSYVQPKVVILSYGANNKYGFPHKDVLERLKAVGAQVYTTEENTEFLRVPPPQEGVGATPGIKAWTSSKAQETKAVEVDGPKVDMKNISPVLKQQISDSL